MRRTCRGSSFRMATAFTHRVGPAMIGVALLLGTPGLAKADPDTMAKLIADVAQANQRLQDLNAQIQTEEESVNKAVVDVETARDNAAAAQHDVEASQQSVRDADAAIVAAQKRFDRFAVASYVNGPSDSYLTAASPDDMIATAAASQALTLSSQQVMDNLQRARTEQLNKDSSARLAKQKADKAVADAQSSQNAAVAALTSAQHKFGEQQQEVTRLGDQRNAAQARLDAARNWSASAGGPDAGPRAASSDRWDPANPGSPSAPRGNGGQWAGEWDPTLPMVPSANVPGDPVVILNKVLGTMSTSSELTSQMGSSFLQQLGLAPAPSGFTNGKIPRVYGRQASEYVIRRAGSQIGVPYSWGGGTAAGPGKVRSPATSEPAYQAPIRTAIEASRSMLILLRKAEKRTCRAQARVRGRPTRRRLAARGCDKARGRRPPHRRSIAAESLRDSARDRRRAPSDRAHP